MPSLAPFNDPLTSPIGLAGFEYNRVDVDGVTINCAVKGAGPPLLLLHGYPQNHLTWRHVAPGLADDHTVVAADLRGYGDSAKPAPDAAGVVYSKRSMAHDQESMAAGQKVECPLLLLWGARGLVGPGYDPLSIWQQYAPDVHGHGLPTGHFVPEEAPELVTAALRDFLD